MLSIATPRIPRIETVWTRLRMSFVVMNPGSDNTKLTQSATTNPKTICSRDNRPKTITQMGLAGYGEEWRRPYS